MNATAERPTRRLYCGLDVCQDCGQSMQIRTGDRYGVNTFTGRTEKCPGSGSVPTDPYWDGLA